MGLVVVTREGCRKTIKKRESNIFRYLLLFLRSSFLRKYFLKSRGDSILEDEWFFQSSNCIVEPLITKKEAHLLSDYKLDWIKELSGNSYLISIVRLTLLHVWTTVQTLYWENMNTEEKQCYFI